MEILAFADVPHCLIFMSMCLRALFLGPCEVEEANIAPFC
jgi:hypothetical protein